MRQPTRDLFGPVIGRTHDRLSRRQGTRKKGSGKWKERPALHNCGLRTSNSSQIFSIRFRRCRHTAASFSDMGMATEDSNAPNISTDNEASSSTNSSARCGNNAFASTINGRRDFSIRGLASVPINASCRGCTSGAVQDWTNSDLIFRKSCHMYSLVSAGKHSNNLEGVQFCTVRPNSTVYDWHHSCQNA